MFERVINDVTDVAQRPSSSKCQGTGSQCRIAQLDVTDPNSIAAVKKFIGDDPIDMLLNVAGIMIDPKSDALDTVNLSVIEKSFAINTYGPLLLSQALLPNVLAAPAPRRLAVVSSRVGSIADNTSGGYYAYRASKCAVNSFFKSLAVDKVAVILRGSRKCFIYALGTGASVILRSICLLLAVDLAVTVAGGIITQVTYGQRMSPVEAASMKLPLTRTMSLAGQGWDASECDPVG